MEIYPAIDIKGGRVVRLVEGDTVRETAYGTDPVDQAKTFLDAGARWLHVVDMDRAFHTGGDNIEWIRRICDFGVVAVQVGGNISTTEWARDALDAGATRVVLGTAALLDTGLLGELLTVVGAARAAVAIDVRHGQVAVRDRSEPVATTAHELADRARTADIETVVYRDLARDGLLVGPDFEGAAGLQSANVDVIAAGGVAGLADIERARAIGLAGVIVGRALHEGRFTLQQAIACSQ